MSSIGIVGGITSSGLANYIISSSINREIYRPYGRRGAFNSLFRIRSGVRISSP